MTSNSFSWRATSKWSYPGLTAKVTETVRPRFIQTAIVKQRQNQRYTWWAGACDFNNVSSTVPAMYSIHGETQFSVLLEPPTRSKELLPAKSRPTMRQISSHCPFVILAASGSAAPSTKTILAASHLQLLNVILHGFHHWSPGTFPPGKLAEGKKLGRISVCQLGSSKSQHLELHPCLGV